MYFFNRFPYCFLSDDNTYIKGISVHITAVKLHKLFDKLSKILIYFPYILSTASIRNI